MLNPILSTGVNKPTGRANGFPEATKPVNVSAQMRNSWPTLCITTNTHSWLCSSSLDLYSEFFKPLQSLLWRPQTLSQAAPYFSEDLWMTYASVGGYKALRASSCCVTRNMCNNTRATNTHSRASLLLMKCLSCTLWTGLFKHHPNCV